MQEEIKHKTVTLTTNATKITGKTLLKMIQMYLSHQKNKKTHPEIPRGKQTVQKLAAQNKGMSSIEITDKNIKCFEKYARKYGVDFALKKDASKVSPKYLVFFKGQDQDAILAAFKNFTSEMVKKASRPSVLTQLREIKAKIKDTVINNVKNKDKEQSL